jgi:hypothetical protein
MKSRKVIITIEAKSDAPLKLLRDEFKLNSEVADPDEDKYYDIEVHQVHVQVVKEDK